MMEQPDETSKRKNDSKKKKEEQDDLVPASNSNIIKKNKSRPKSVFSEKRAEMKALIRDIGKLPELNDDEMRKFLAAVALGMVPDSFGLEASLDTKLKAIQLLQQQTKIVKEASSSDDEEEAVTIVDSVIGGDADAVH